jgi:MFS family permease
MASELLYPVAPIYLKEIGFSVLSIGFLEGIAEFIVGVSKGYFAKLSDEKGVRLPFIKTGYFLSTISKPLMAVFTLPLWIFFVRTIDRLGKGLRGPARDALLSQQATTATKARIFGFHRSMDTIGAVIGPLLALLFLHFSPGKYKQLFYWALLPGLIAVLLIFLLKDKRTPSSSEKKGFFSYFRYWKTASLKYRQLIVGLLIFAIANSSDVFLLLKTKEITQSDTITIAAYIFYNLIFALSAYPAGIVADKLGLKKVLLVGLLLFTIVYAGFAITNSVAIVFGLLALYGIYAAFTEGIAKAWITNVAHRNSIATAIGLYHSLQSIATLLASSVAGFLWTEINSAACFLFSSCLALVAVVYLSLIKKTV